MIIKKAEFVVSNQDPSNCPDPTIPEYAFIGRSNVGKSSLINMLCDNKKLAKTSSTPGKTQLINHFQINEEWYLVDLPGYGFAKVPIKEKKRWEGFIRHYLQKRENLMNVFVLIDCRHKPQKIDLKFMEFLGENEIPFSMVFTKIDKLSSAQLAKNVKSYQTEMLKTWEELPPIFKTSAESKFGKEFLLNYIEETNKVF